MKEKVSKIKILGFFLMDLPRTELDLRFAQLQSWYSRT